MKLIVQHILDKKKNAKIWTISPDDTVQSALEIMASKKIGALPVMTGTKMVGIISERDYLRKAVPKRQLPWELNVKDLMTEEVIHVEPKESFDDCMELMSENHFRHLPVIENNEFVGFISITDIIELRRGSRLL